MPIIYRETWTNDPKQRQIIEAAQETARLTSMAITDLRANPVRTSSGINASFGQLVLADTHNGKLTIVLPQASQTDIGRTVTIKMWSSAPTGIVYIQAPLSGKIDGNDNWRLTRSMQAVIIAYAGNNDWAIVSEVSGVGNVIMEILI